VRSGSGAARTILRFHTIGARPSKQPLMVRTFLTVYGAKLRFLFLQGQFKDDDETQNSSSADCPSTAAHSTLTLARRRGGSTFGPHATCTPSILRRPPSRCRRSCLGATGHAPLRPSPSTATLWRFLITDYWFWDKRFYNVRSVSRQH
jgi:hypothetical protein